MPWLFSCAQECPGNAQTLHPDDLDDQTLVMLENPNKRPGRPVDPDQSRLNRRLIAAFAPVSDSTGPFDPSLILLKTGTVLRKLQACLVSSWSAAGQRVISGRSIPLITMGDEKSLKRQRVSKACEKCRILKAKCDGQQPVCGRCTGYGFTCVWSSSRSRSSLQPGGSRVIDQTTLRSIVASYEALVMNLKERLDERQRSDIEASHAYIQSHLPLRFSSSNEPQAPESNLPLSTHTYVGTASDTHFFNTIKHAMSANLDTSKYRTDTERYDQPDSLRGIPRIRKPLRLPSAKLCHQYLDIFFSTIHCAFPFLSRATVEERLERISADGASDIDPSWTAQLSFLFAIGACYTSLTESARLDDIPHQQYFAQGLLFFDEMYSNSSLQNVSLVLTQCFYLLATCQTDRAWNILGLAIRMAQSLGLHVGASQWGNVEEVNPQVQEERRRVWFSLYILDRLLALQLGRPVGIQQADFHVELPSRAEDIRRINLQAADELSVASSMDYFLSLIEFSHIVGRVNTELYQPVEAELSSKRLLLSTASLDWDLVQWKDHLPHHLRFDLGHTLERSLVFRRQRNMFAIKYHHLRALIHRPFLCMSRLHQSSRLFGELFQHNRSRIDEAELICITEAQEMAHLLHNIPDERSLVHDFPWWQMISCLICASSILVVAATFFEPSPASTSSELRTKTFDEDAETCLKVFEALSTNSKAAFCAKSMLKSLQQLKVKSKVRRVETEPTQTSVKSAITSSSSKLGNTSGDLNLWQQWPSEISDTMQWSAQYLDLPQDYLPNFEFGLQGPGWQSQPDSSGLWHDNC